MGQVGQSRARQALEFRLDLRARTGAGGEECDGEKASHRTPATGRARSFYEKYNRGMTPKIPLLALCASVLFAAAGCASIGRPFPTDKIKGIVLGKTTQSDIESSDGHPYRTGIEDGDVTWSYVDEHYAAFGEPRTTDLQVRFNADGTVKSYNFNTNQ